MVAAPRQAVAEIPGVRSTVRALTVQLAPDQVFAILSLEFDDDLRTPEVERLIARLEDSIKDAQPQVVRVSIRPEPGEDREKLAVRCARSAQALVTGIWPVLSERGCMSTPNVDPAADISTLWITVNHMAAAFLALLPHLAVALVVFAAFWFGARLVRRVVIRLTHTRNHANVGLVIGRLAQWALLFLGVLIALSVVAPSVNPGNILSVLGFGGVAIGFAFKDILQNFLAGILILLQEPFRVGDQIVFKTFEGTVQQIDTRSTKIQTYDGRLVIIPNGELFVNSVIVNTAYRFRRSEYDVGIGYGDSIEKARDVILSALATIDGVLADPAPDVVPFELAQSSVNLKVRWWSDSKRSDVVRARGDVITVLKAAMDKAQIDLPFPTQVVLFHDQTEETDGVRGKQREGWPKGDNPPAPRGVAAMLGKRDERAEGGRVQDRGERAHADADEYDARSARRTRASERG